MIYYAILHTPSGAYLPEPPGHLRARGYTHTEPTKNYPPRLFRDEASAKRALTWWLKGTTTTGTTFSFETGDVDGEDFHTEPKPGRKAEDMTVASLSLHLTSERC